MRSRVCAAAAVTICLLANAAWGCEGKTVIFEDDFQDDLGGWPGDSTSMKFDKGTMVLQPPVNFKTTMRLNAAFTATDLDLCAEAVFPTENPEAGPSIGVLFWGIDYANLYLAHLSLKGTAGLTRRFNQKWATIWEQDVPKAKQGPGASNIIRVVAKGNLVSVYINGEKVRDTRAQPPGEARFGTYAERNTAVEGQNFMFKKFKVTKPD